MNVFDTIDFDILVRYWIALVVVVATLAMIIYSIWWGFLMILSAGKEDKVKSAVNYIRHALIGVFFLIIVLFVFPVISRLVGLSYPEYATPGVIFDTISEITNRIFNTNLNQDGESLPWSSSTLSPSFSDL